MLNVVDALLSLVAPHMCIGCGSEGAVLCYQCQTVAGEPPPPRCAGCKALSSNYQTCYSCRSWLDVYAVYVSNHYEGLYEELVKAYKFKLRRQAAIPMAQMMHTGFSPIADGDAMLLCPMPTAHARIRQRGFDHSLYLAKAYLRMVSGTQRNTLQLCSALGRRSNSRQLGSSREQRIRQMTNEFFITNATAVQGRTVLLIDDVTTTSASLAAAARTLKVAGARRVYAVVFAQKT